MRRIFNIRSIDVLTISQNGFFVICPAGTVNSGITDFITITVNRQDFTGIQRGAQLTVNIRAGVISPAFMVNFGNNRLNIIPDRGNGD